MLNADGMEHRAERTFHIVRQLPFLTVLIVSGLLCVSCTSSPSLNKHLSLKQSIQNMWGGPTSGSSAITLLEFERRVIEDLLFDVQDHKSNDEHLVVSTSDGDSAQAVYDSLLEMLTDTNWLTRLKAAVAIEQLHDERGWQALQPLRRDPDVVVRMRVTSILSDWTPLTAKSFAATDELIVFDNVNHKPDGPRVIITRADGFFAQEDYASALDEYHRFLDVYPTHMLVPYAEYKLGETHFRMATSVDRDRTPVETALQIFQVFLKRYPETFYRRTVSTKIRECHNWLAEADFFVGQFYYQQEKYSAAAHRFGKILNNYPEVDVTRDALYYLAQAYKEIGPEMWAQARDILVTLNQKYPNHPYGEESALLLAELNDQPTITVATTLTPRLREALRSEVDQDRPVAIKVATQEGNMVTDRSPVAASLTALGSQPSKSNNRITQAGKPNRRDCLNLATNSAPVASLSLASQFDCDLALPQNDLHLKFSYDQQRWNTSYVRNYKDLLQYMNKQNNLARSSGNLNILGDKLKGQFELAYSDPTYRDRLKSDSKQGMGSKVRINGSHEGFEYWSQYQYLGKDFTKYWNTNPGDREETQLGAKYNWGMFKPMVELRRISNNVGGDSDKNQTKTNKGKMALEIAVPQWPTLTLSYLSELKETTNKPNGTLVNNVLSDGVSANLRHSWVPGLETYFTTSYNSIDDAVESGSKTDLTHYQLGGTWGTHGEGFTISPNLGFMQRRDQQSQNLTEALSANIGVNYASTAQSLKVSFSGSSNMMQDSNKYVDTQNIGLSLNIEKDLKKLLHFPHRTQSISLKLNYYDYSNFIYSNASASVSTALFLFKLIP